MLTELFMTVLVNYYPEHHYWILIHVVHFLGLAACSRIRLSTYILCFYFSSVQDPFPVLSELMFAPYIVWFTL